MNTILDRMLGADGFSEAPIETTIRATTTMACNTTLSHRPVVQRPCGGVLNRASSNRIDMCRTELKCRSVLLQRRCCLGSSYSKRSAAALGGSRTSNPPAWKAISEWLAARQQWLLHKSLRPDAAELRTRRVRVIGWLAGAWRVWLRDLPRAFGRRCRLG